MYINVYINKINHIIYCVANLVTLGGVRGLLTLELAVSGIIAGTSTQFNLLCGVGLIIFGDIMIFFYTTMKHASLLYYLQ